MSWTLQLELPFLGGNQLWAVWGTSPTDVFTVGDGGLIFHYDGNTWTQQSTGVPTTFFRAVWASSSTDVFAVGHPGTILHYDGNSWSQQVSPTTKQLLGIWGFASDDVFSVGDSGVDGEIHHYDGTTWTTLPIISTESLFGIWGASRTDLFVVGQSGGVFHGVSSTISVELDIKPQSCPNPLNTKSKGVLPVAVLGTANFDVSDIDVSTVQLEGVSPLRSSIEDVAATVTNRQDDCDCTTDGPDGFDDLTLKFDRQDIVAALGAVNDGDEVQLTLTGNLNDGTAIEGVDCVVIKKKGK